MSREFARCSPAIAANSSCRYATAKNCHAAAPIGGSCRRYIVLDNFGAAGMVETQHDACLSKLTPARKTVLKAPLHRLRNNNCGILEDCHPEALCWPKDLPE